MRTRIGAALVTGAAIWVVGSPAQAELQGRDLDGDPSTFEAYYDTVLGITWLADANYAKSSGYDSDGYMQWATAMAWAEGLVYGGFDDWRLPKVEPVGPEWNYNLSNNGTTDHGWGITSPHSEMSYMYYVNLGNKGYCTPDNADPSGCTEQPGWGLQNTGPFANLQDRYWSGTPIEAYAESVWVFFFGSSAYINGQQDGGHPLTDYFAWAVRDGDVDSLVKEFALKTPEVAGCKNVTGTVTISKAAPPEGVVITLSDTLVSASTPATLKILAGSTTKSFAVKTLPVEIEESGTISATLGSATLSQPLTVRPMGMDSMTLTPTTVVGSQPATGKAKLECKAGPGPIAVDLSSNNEAVAYPVAASIVVPQGLQSATFDVATNVVLAKSYATIAGTANGITKSKKLTVKVAAAVSPTSLKFGGATVGTTAGPLNASLTNQGAVPFSVNSISLTGTAASWFAQTNDCPATLAAGASCSVSVTFTPLSAASKSAKLSIATSATATPLGVSLSGTGVLPP